MFNPCKEDSASGFPIEPPSSTHIIESSEDSKRVYPTRTFHSGPLVNPSKTGTSKHGEHHVRAVADPRNFPVVVSAKSDTRPDDSNGIGFTQAEAFAHGRRLSESINGHFSGSGKYDQVFHPKDDKSAGRVDGGAIVSTCAKGESLFLCHFIHGHCMVPSNIICCDSIAKAELVSVNPILSLARV